MEKYRDLVTDFLRRRSILDIMGVVFLLMIFIVTLVAVTAIQFLLPPEATAFYKAQTESSQWLFISVLILLPSITTAVMVGLTVALNRQDEKEK